MVKDLYMILLHGDYEDVIDAVLLIDAPKEYPLKECILALTYSLLKKHSEARDALANISREECNDTLMSICLEAEMFIAASNKESPKVIEGFAKEAVSLNPKAVFAHRMLGQIAESRRDAKEALYHYQVVLKVYPESQKTLFDCARILIGLKRPMEALEYLRYAKPSLRREIYRFSTHQKRLARVIIILVIAALILNPWTSIYAFWFITGASVIGSVAALVMRDGLILSKVLFLEFIAVVIMILKRILFLLSTG